MKVKRGTHGQEELQAIRRKTGRLTHRGRWTDDRANKPAKIHTGFTQKRGHNIS